MPLKLEIQKRECQTLIFLLKDLEWTPGERKTGIYNVKFCTQNTEHFLSIEYDSGQELLDICVDGHQSTEKLSIFNFAGNLAGLLGISINEVYLKLAGIDSKAVMDLFRIEQNQEGLTILGKPVPRTRFDIKASTETLWTEYENRFSMVWPSNGIRLSSPIGRIIASEFKNVAVTYILEKYLTARYINHINLEVPLREEILDLGRSFSPTLVNTFGYFDIPLCYFDRVHLSWPWCGEDCWPITQGTCRDFAGLIVSAEMMVHDELNPFDDRRHYYTCNKPYLEFTVRTPYSFSFQWLKHDMQS
ncbi:hypothetical protein [Escherichia coli]|uniref:hypothetical protein n=1 Tax=Escherichia coli TaxID=562 RepID=UPI0021BE99C1|nr:hypothetical protein [Escherichia coli]